MTFPFLNKFQIWGDIKVYSGWSMVWREFSCSYKHWYVTNVEVLDSPMTELSLWIHQCLYLESKNSNFWKKNFKGWKYVCIFSFFFNEINSKCGREWGWQKKEISHPYLCYRYFLVYQDDLIYIYLPCKWYAYICIEGLSHAIPVNSQRQLLPYIFIHWLVSKDFKSRFLNTTASAMRQINRLSSLYSSAPIFIFFLLVLISAMGCNLTSPNPLPIFIDGYIGGGNIFGDMLMKVPHKCLL